MAATARPGVALRGPWRSARRRILLALWLVPTDGDGADRPPGVTEADRRDERHRGPVWLRDGKLKSHRGDPGAECITVLVVVRHPACDPEPHAASDASAFGRSSPFAIANRNPDLYAAAVHAGAHPDARAAGRSTGRCRGHHVRHRGLCVDGTVLRRSGLGEHHIVGGDTGAAPLDDLTAHVRGVSCRCRAEQLTLLVGSHLLLLGDAGG